MDPCIYSTVIKKEKNKCALKLVHSGLARSLHKYLAALSVFSAGASKAPSPAQLVTDGVAEVPRPDMVYELIWCYLVHCTAALNLHILFSALSNALTSW